MRVSFRVVLLCATAAGLVLPVTGQTTRSRTTTLTMGNPAPAARLPYTAEYKITRVEMLASGVTITHESTETVALDSQGRRMASTTFDRSSMTVTVINVIDPVARTNNSWTVPGKKVTVMQMPEPGAPRPSCTPAVTAGVISSSATQRPKPVVEDLGTRTINGVETRGRRYTTTTPAGAIGNDAPLARTSEMWTAIAPGLRGLVVRDTTDDQQWGKMTKELTNFTQAEPDASVFQPPSDYEIVNKPAPDSACPAQAGSESSTALIPPPPPEQ